MVMSRRTDVVEYNVEMDLIMEDLILVKLNLPYPPFARVVFYLRKFNLHILG